jgi:hypothetical protein
MRGENVVVAFPDVSWPTSSRSLVFVFVLCCVASREVFTQLAQTLRNPVALKPVHGRHTLRLPPDEFTLTTPGWQVPLPPPAPLPSDGNPRRFNQRRVLNAQPCV